MTWTQNQMPLIPFTKQIPHSKVFVLCFFGVWLEWGWAFMYEMTWQDLFQFLLNTELFPGTDNSYTMPKSMIPQCLAVHFPGYFCLFTLLPQFMSHTQLSSINGRHLNVHPQRQKWGSYFGEPGLDEIGTFFKQVIKI